MTHDRRDNPQYADDRNLSARLGVHARFSTNPHGWMAWVFDQFDLPPDASILEVGCGTGELWATNWARVPARWRLTLTDGSAGMLDAARKALAGREPSPAFAVLDACAIDPDAGPFDAVIADHMLYHVADLDAALAGIRRVLKAGGVLYATTNGPDHITEVRDLVRPFAPDLPLVRAVHARAFGLHNGAALLGRRFDSVERRLYDDALRVTEAEPLVDYILSGIGVREALDEAAVEYLRRTIEERIVADGAVHVTKSAGIFVAHKALPGGCR